MTGEESDAQAYEHFLQAFWSSCDETLRRAAALAVAEGMSLDVFICSAENAYNAAEEEAELRRG